MKAIWHKIKRIAQWSQEEKFSFCPLYKQERVHVLLWHSNYRRFQNDGSFLMVHEDKRNLIWKLIVPDIICDPTKNQVRIYLSILSRRSANLILMCYILLIMKNKRCEFSPIFNPSVQFRLWKRTVNKRNLICLACA